MEALYTFLYTLLSAKQTYRHWRRAARVSAAKRRDHKPIWQGGSNVSPDQLYDLGMLRQQDLHMEAARARMAAQARGATNDRPAYLTTTMRALALRLGAWLRLAAITRAGASRG